MPNYSTYEENLILQIWKFQLNTFSALQQNSVHCSICVLSNMVIIGYLWLLKNQSAQYEGVNKNFKYYFS